MQAVDAGSAEQRGDKASEGPSQRAVRDLPDPPKKYWKYVGPGVVAGGVGLASGEFILWPYIASQVGLVLLWGALLGVLTQFYLNMEVERYTLATGETAVSGFNRFWKHWGLVFAVLVYFANLWPGWAVSSATLATYLFDAGNPSIIAAIGLLVIGAGLTLAPVIYIALERMIFVKVAAMAVLIGLSLAFAIRPVSWEALPAGVFGIGNIPTGLTVALVFGAIAFAGSGGGQNLCQSNWIRDKGFGMGEFVPRLVSPITGEEEAVPTARSFTFEPTPENMARWNGWWKFANIEQIFSFGLMTVVTIILMSMLAHSTVFGLPDLPNSVAFLEIEAQQLRMSVGPWFGTLFLAIGTFALFGSAMGVIDYTSRLAADVLKTTYLTKPTISESRIYFWLVWGMVGLGCVVLLAGVSQPLTLLVISASTGGATMFLYSMLLIALNKKHLPVPIRVRGFRLGVLVWSSLAFGVLTVVTIYFQLQRLMVGG